MTSSSTTAFALSKAALLALVVSVVLGVMLLSVIPWGIRSFFEAALKAITTVLRISDLSAPILYLP
jgi:hypothetical protein